MKTGNRRQAGATQVCIIPSMIRPDLRCHSGLATTTEEGRREEEEGGGEGEEEGGGGGGGGND